MRPTFKIWFDDKEDAQKFQQIVFSKGYTYLSGHTKLNLVNRAFAFQSINLINRIGLTLYINFDLEDKPYDEKEERRLYEYSEFPEITFDEFLNKYAIEEKIKLL